MILLNLSFSPVSDCYSIIVWEGKFSARERDNRIMPESPNTLVTNHGARVHYTTNDNERSVADGQSRLC